MHTFKHTHTHTHIHTHTHTHLFAVSRVGGGGADSELHYLHGSSSQPAFSLQQAPAWLFLRDVPWRGEARRSVLGAWRLELEQLELHAGRADCFDKEECEPECCQTFLLNILWSPLPSVLSAHVIFCNAINYTT